MSEILIDHVLLDRVTKDAKESPRLRMNYNFHESLSSPSQRLLNALEPGTVLPIHRHRHTAETYVLLRGRMRVLFYDDDKKEINRYELDPAEGTYGVNIYWAQNEMYMGGDRKKEKRFVGQRVVYDDGIKAYKTKCLRGFN